MISVILTIFLIAVLQLLIPAWWWILAIPFLSGVINREFLWRTILGHALGVGLLWTGVSLLLWFNGGDRIVTRVQELMGLPAAWLLVPVCAVLAIIVAGLAYYSGAALRRLLIQEQQLG